MHTIPDDDARMRAVEQETRTLKQIRAYDRYYERLTYPFLTLGETIVDYAVRIFVSLAGFAAVCAGLYWLGVIVRRW